MDKMIRVEFPVKAQEDGLVVGYANKAVVDHGRELIPADAWFSGLGDFFREGQPIRLLHRKKIPAGETVGLEILPDGLKLTSRPISPVLEMVKMGLISAYSVGFYVVEAQMREDGVLEITKLRLKEISYVDDPQNPGSFFEGKIMALRSDVRVSFDPSTGTVTALGLTPDEMAYLSEILGEGLSKAVPAEATVKTLSFKMADEDPEVTMFNRFKEFLRLFATHKEDVTMAEPENHPFTPPPAAADPAVAKGADPEPTLDPTPAPVPDPTPEPTPDHTLASRLEELEQKFDQPSALEQRLEALEANVGKLIDVVSKMSPATNIPVGAPQSPEPTAKSTWGLGWDEN